jgi:hypothetical protein
MNWAGQHRDAVPADLVAKVLTGDADGIGDLAVQRTDIAGRITPHITGSKKQSEERAVLFAVRVHVIVSLLIY